MKEIQWGVLPWEEEWGQQDQGCGGVGGDSEEVVSAEDLLQPDPTGALEEDTAELVPIEARGGGGLLYPPCRLIIGLGLPQGGMGERYHASYAFFP